MNNNRLAALMNKLTDQADFADLLTPAERALNKIRLGHADGRVRVADTRLCRTGCAAPLSGPTHAARANSDLVAFRPQ